MSCVTQNRNLTFAIFCILIISYLELTYCPTLISPSPLDGSNSQVTLEILIILHRVTLGLYQLRTLGRSVCIDT